MQKFQVSISRYTRSIMPFASLLLVLSVVSCKSNREGSVQGLVFKLSEHLAIEGDIRVEQDALEMTPGSWAEYELDVPVSGRYRVRVAGSSDSGFIWLEDYVHNTDGRTYNITGNMLFNEDGSNIDGSPLQKGKHNIRIHAERDRVLLRSIHLELMHAHKTTPTNQIQNMDGTEWQLKWSDEFDGSGLPDSNKWAYNVGNWGWGNNELQYYTLADTQNVRVENGVLRIGAVKDANTGSWTSARLTTQGKVSFTYGKIEFRAKIPGGRGTWTAGWLLGDSYRDEISWPYCGEIDVLESVGFEMDPETGHGINHATCHTRSYYFKQGNQIGADTVVHHMRDSFHTYSVEWYPDVIYGSVDGKRYYTYDKNADTLEWPFHKAQNIILNLAVGGGWGGAKGIDPDISEQEFIVDHVRVYERK
ncbi:MAG: family 16 glycosylhydrolase [Flavobacteriales bacterium]|nr:family 16 glycosylhydrolase [Flavobacteriales bacterium]